MKTTITATLLAVATTIFSAASADTVKPFHSSTRNISINGFNKLVVAENITVVLVPDQNINSVTVTGDEKYLGAIKASTEKDILTIAAGKFKKSRVTVYVPVKELTRIELKSGATIASAGFLSCPALEVVVSPGSSIALENRGKLTIKPTDDCDIVYEKEEVSKLVYIK